MLLFKKLSEESEHKMNSIERITEERNHKVVFMALFLSLLYPGVQHSCK